MAKHVVHIVSLCKACRHLLCLCALAKNSLLALNNLKDKKNQSRFCKLIKIRISWRKRQKRIKTWICRDRVEAVLSDWPTNRRTEQQLDWHKSHQIRARPCWYKYQSDCSVADRKHSLCRRRLSADPPLLFSRLNAENAGTRFATSWESEQFSPLTSGPQSQITSAAWAQPPLHQQIDGEKEGKSMASSPERAGSVMFGSLMLPSLTLPPLWEIERRVWTSWQTWTDLSR